MRPPKQAAKTAAEDKKVEVGQRFNRGIHRGPVVQGLDFDHRLDQHFGTELP